MTDLDQLSTEFGSLFLRMHRLLDRRMSASGASFARTKLLMYVHRHGPARAADIAELFSLAPRTVTEALDGMERDGLVVREPDARDRRVKRISITPAGKRAIETTEPIRARLVELIFGTLDVQERAQLSGIVEKLAVAVAREEGDAGLACSAPEQG
ncbi:MarR family winged helix-turn-helix transcriptional regulator [Sphingomonas xinjiangensis]|uniref:DNA-binding MarR family transcriptional regulator n=1 Tax=Sphingomonas xinjiangensis TaxID=643568 RepID=A0A840YP85_9SPHN|nr:MarR family transcriptional regulator [Sphingomonas xinjiangensis]MBB5709901.1 DNA-binding MarR family transcriptional regulator [Sphingomonas xinjiangensis]